METKEFTIETTLNGKQISVPVVQYCAAPDRAFSTRNIGLYRKNGAGKVWTRKLTFSRKEDGSWQLWMHTTILNRAGYRLIGLDDKELSESVRSQHISA